MAKIKSNGNLEITREECEDIKTLLFVVSEYLEETPEEIVSMINDVVEDKAITTAKLRSYHDKNNYFVVEEEEDLDHY